MAWPNPLAAFHDGSGTRSENLPACGPEVTIRLRSSASRSTPWALADRPIDRRARTALAVAPASRTVSAPAVHVVNVAALAVRASVAVTAAGSVLRPAATKATIASAVTPQSGLVPSGPGREPP